VTSDPGPHGGQDWAGCKAVVEADGAACSIAVAAAGTGSLRTVTSTHLGGYGVCLQKVGGCWCGERKKVAETEEIRRENAKVRGRKERRR